MKTVMVRYKLRPGQAAENERLIGAVFAQLADEQPESTSYQVFRLPDGLSFIHIACIPDGANPHPITSLRAFKQFVIGIKDRAEEGPETTEISAVGKYLG